LTGLIFLHKQKSLTNRLLYRSTPWKWIWRPGHTSGARVDAVKTNHFAMARTAGQLFVLLK